MPTTLANILIVWLIAVLCASEAAEARSPAALRIVIVTVCRPRLEFVIANVWHELRSDVVKQPRPSVAHSPILLAILIVHDWCWEEWLIALLQFLHGSCG